MDLKSYCRSFVAFDGQIEFFLLPYRPLQVDSLISDLNIVSPETGYYNAKTKKRTTEMPDSYRKAKVVASALDTTVRGDWREEVVWNATHRIFYLYQGSTVEINFAFNEATPVELLMFRDYWEHRTGVVAEDWPIFKQIIGQQIAITWRDAYDSTRDRILEAPPGLQAEVGQDAPEEKKEPEPELNPTS